MNTLSLFNQKKLEKVRKLFNKEIPVDVFLEYEILQG